MIKQFLRRKTLLRRRQTELDKFAHSRVVNARNDGRHFTLLQQKPKIT
jgi:hypothetical protein